MKLKIPFLNTGSDIYKGIQQTQQYTKGKALMVFKNNGCVLINGTVSPDLLFFKPIGFNRLYRIEGEYNLHPKNEKFFIIMDENVETINLKNIPQIKKFQKIEKFDVIENGEVKKTMVMNEYAIKGASELSAMAFLFSKVSLLKFMDEPSKRELLFICIISVVTGMLLGIIGAFTFMGGS